MYSATLKTKQQQQQQQHQPEQIAMAHLQPGRRTATHRRRRRPTTPDCRRPRPPAVVQCTPSAARPHLNVRKERAATKHTHEADKTRPSETPSSAPQIHHRVAARPPGPATAQLSSQPHSPRAPHRLHP
ncbi:hypothetical protein PYCCODRAFT_177331 [Trametes coccinea BRFM310]|uniref:Uncharacterized protein n=1 Tax=Trametes coccinea (strain BRFM310) TaxID=1353009 RepID=A0A1Y2ISL9_TRAC3|nr:hypothetical protein PYCCODRAFT_177331 [Trametes coccinea BRFM310]